MTLLFQVMQAPSFGWGTRKNTKRAIVSLKEGTIDIFGGPLS